MAQNILLCGGPDRCGKTTILAEVSRRTGVPVFKASNAHETFLSRQDRFIAELQHSDFRMLDLLRQVGFSVLVDRAYMCEFAYANVYRRKTDEGAIRSLDEGFASLNSKVLICTRKSFKGMSDDLDAYLDEDKLSRLSNLYHEFVSWTRCENKIVYVDDEDIDRHVNEVMDLMGL